MTKKHHLKALERVWVAEIENRLPLQSSAKVFRELHESGLVDIDRAQHGHLIVSGWCLTHAGRILYCLSCEDEPEDERVSP